MTTLLTPDCEGENLAFQLHLPVPVWKSAFVLLAYQWNQGRLEMLSFYRARVLASPTLRGKVSFCNVW